LENIRLLFHPELPDGDIQFGQAHIQNLL